LGDGVGYKAPKLKLSMEMPLRRATPDDLPQLEAFEKSCFPDPWSRVILSQVMAQERYLVLIGPASYLIASKVCDEVEIERIAVLEENRGQGLGRQILELALEKLKNTGATRFFLEVRANNKAAIRLYEGCGFVSNGLRRGYYDDGQDAVLMSLSISTG
jgi:ribosomal-protein-alanine N-acetyltransferase